MANGVVCMHIFLLFGGYFDGVFVDNRLLLIVPHPEGGFVEMRELGYFMLIKKMKYFVFIKLICCIHEKWCCGGFM